MRGSLQAYKQVSVNSQLASASPHRVVLMLLGGAVERLIQAKAAMEQGNVAMKGERVSKALAIIGTLKDSLSMEDGGEVATNLDNLYDFMLRHIIDGSTNNKPENFTEVVDLLREIKSAWEQIPAEYHHLAEES